MSIEGHCKRWGSIEGGGASLLTLVDVLVWGSASTEGNCGHHVSPILEQMRASQWRPCVRSCTRCTVLKYSGLDGS